MSTVHAPLSDEIREALKSLFEMRWSGVRQELSQADWFDFQRLCRPDSSDYILNAPDPETERKEIRTTIRLMRESYERGLYEGEEYIYWQKVNALKEKLDLLNRLPETAIERAARTLLDLRESCEWSTKEECKNHCAHNDPGIRRRHDCQPHPVGESSPGLRTLFSILSGLRLDGERRYWIEHRDSEGNISDVEIDLGQMSTGVEIVLQMSHDILTITAEHIK